MEGRYQKPNVEIHKGVDFLPYYRFRQANPDIFLQKYNNYSEDENNVSRKILLYKNFRSRKEVIEAINFIFKQIMSEGVGELEYNEKEKLNLGAEYKEAESCFSSGGPVELHLIENKINEVSSVDMEDENPSNIQIEARMVSNRIEELIDNEKLKVFDKDISDYRDVTYKDIVVLLRSTKKWAPVFIDEFKEKGIPVYADTNVGYFDNVEIKTMLSLLQVIDNPIQDIPLISLMNSPIGGFNQEELVKIKSYSKKDSYYEKMKEIVDEKLVYVDSDTEIIKNKKEDVNKDNEEIHIDLKEKIEAFLKNITSWHEKAIHMPLDEFIWYLYKSTGYYGYVGAMPGGEQRQANLKVLFQRAKQYESTSYKGLFNFINFINRLKDSSGDMGSAKIIGENENVVRIMSIHKSKGLEFPVVIVAGMGKKFNLMDINKSLLFHEKLGFGPDYVNLEKRLTYPSLMKQVIKNKIKLESLSEEMRILYVALTRAKEKLIITGMVKNLEKSIAKWSLSIEKNNIKLSKFERANAVSFLDWIVPCIMRNKHGDILLKKANIKNIDILEDPSIWKIRLWNRSELLKGEQVSMEDMIKESPSINEFTIDEEIYNKVDEKLNYKYYYEKSSEIPTVITVTELKRKVNESAIEDYSSHIFIPSLIKKPVFMQEKKALSAAEKGTALHAVMQRLQLDKIENYSDIKGQIDHMVNKELLTEEEAKTININKILHFFTSPIGIRMKKAEKVNREVPFHIQISSSEIYKQLPNDIYKDEKIMLQGIIDCYFEENGQIILLDYKTDYVESEEKIKERYKVQLEYYAKAIQEITGKKVSEKYLYLFYNNSTLLI